jgi:AcrR family transcriptional regulator
VPAAPRRRRPRGSLNPEAILDAAEAIAASDGFGALSMRAVAGSLGAAPMALYNHVATRDALVDALLDRVLHRFAPEPPTDDWAEDLRRFARAHRRVLTEHPWAVAPLFSQPNPGLGAVRIGEHALGILARGGYEGGRAVAAFSGLIALNYGWSSFTAARELDTRGATTEVAGMLAALPAEHFPRIVATAAEMGAYGSDEHYELVLGGLVSGLVGGR